MATIIESLWPEFLEAHKQDIKDAIELIHGVTTVAGNPKVIYTPGEDSADILLKFPDELWRLVGYIHIDYGAPELTYELL